MAKLHGSAFDFCIAGILRAARHRKHQCIAARLRWFVVPFFRSSSFPRLVGVSYFLITAPHYTHIGI